MNKLALAFALGAATLFSAGAVNAADTTTKSDSAINATVADDGSQVATDISSRHRRWHRWHRYGYRPYYRSYGYYPGYYYNPGPVISFGFGGGPRFHHRHWW